VARVATNHHHCRRVSSPWRQNIFVLFPGAHHHSMNILECLCSDDLARALMSLSRCCCFWTSGLRSHSAELFLFVIFLLSDVCHFYSTSHFQSTTRLHLVFVSRGNESSRMASVLLRDIARCCCCCWLMAGRVVQEKSQC
jgi:hypothetical protein